MWDRTAIGAGRPAGGRMAAVSLQQRIFASLYRRAPGPEALPWHREEPPALLARAVAARQAPGRALDLGCGAGVHAVYLAQKGYAVWGVDFVPRALELAAARARAAGVSVELVEADVLACELPAPFELVLDSGCLHHIPAAQLPAYRARLDRWLAPGGDYLLVHFGKRHALDWRPVGPRRTRRERIVEIFAPLRLEAYEETLFELPLPAGPTGMAGVYWFRR